MTWPGRRALVVEDSRAARLAAARLVEPYGFDVEFAEDGAQALKQVERGGPYDVLLVDVRMPVVDGHELIRILRTRSNFTPVILMTAGGTRTVAATLKLGVTDFVTKPLSAEPVRAALARALAVPTETLAPEAQRCLVVGAPACAETLGRALPAFVQVDEAHALDAADPAQAYGLVVLDARDRPPSAAFAERALARFPGACLCAIAADLLAPGFDVCVRFEDLGEAAVSSLHPNALRPLVVRDGSAVLLGAFGGAVETEALYFAIAARRLHAAVDAATRPAALRLTVDLSRAPPRSGAVERLAGVVVDAAGGRAHRLHLVVAPAMLGAVEHLGLPARVEVPASRAGPRMVFRWTPDLAVGHELLDAQHRALFERVNAVIRAAGTAEEEFRVLDGLGALVEELARHAADEEAIMAAARYPAYAAHREQHEGFRARIRELAAAFTAAGNAAEGRARFEREVCDWLYHHVRKVDRELGQFLAAAAG